MRVLVTGGAGFLGSHLCDSLIKRGDYVICVDNLSTGSLNNISHLINNNSFEFHERDIGSELETVVQVEVVAHLASAASPQDYLRMPIETLVTGSRGTEWALRVAEANNARFVLASTSEVYGDPSVHPQSEEYWGNVNPIGTRSVYDEAKRFAEALTSAYGRTRGANVGIIRIFNTYGPRMNPGDGRVVTNFITQALRENPITIYGTGDQTRSFCYVDDLIRGIIKMVDSSDPGPINLGNPEELTIGELAKLVLQITGSSSHIEYHPLPIDDPTRRRPVITKAIERLDWLPEVPIAEGVAKMAEWTRMRLWTQIDDLPRIQDVD